MTNIIACALDFATKAHDGQKRKYTGEPYINHPKAVANMILDQRMADEVVAGALLHDVVEDCGVTLDEIEAEFGEVVRRLVYEVTDISRPEDGNRATRKAIDREHYGRASPEGKSIKLADLIDNTQSIVPRDPGFAKVYLAEKRLLLPLLVEGNPHLWKKASALARAI
jgi:guanosine-3',5'-bis(diphosphate) 3'-pyrophosphohydrolase